MAVNAVTSNNEHQEVALQASLPVARQRAVDNDWRNRGGGPDRIRPFSEAAVTAANVHNSALVLKLIFNELAETEDVAEQITRDRPGLAPHLAELQEMAVHGWKVKFACYLARGRV
jgi:hypothetical protein